MQEKEKILVVRKNYIIFVLEQIKKKFNQLKNKEL